MAINDAFTTGQTLTSAEMNNLPFGLVAQTSATATTSIVANTNLTVLSLSATIVPNRRYRLCGTATAQATGGAATVMMLFVECTGMTTTTLVFDGHNLPQFFHITLHGQMFFTAADVGVTTGTGTSKTFDLRWRMNAGGALATNPDALIGANSTPQELWIEDVGSA